VQGLELCLYSKLDQSKCIEIGRGCTRPRRMTNRCHFGCSFQQLAGRKRQPQAGLAAAAGCAGCAGCASGLGRRLKKSIAPRNRRAAGVGPCL